jgi:hypothetical protein
MQHTLIEIIFEEVMYMNKAHRNGVKADRKKSKKLRSDRKLAEIIVGRLEFDSSGLTL